MIVHTCSEFRASQYFCCRIEGEMETSVGSILPASQSGAERSGVEQSSAPALCAQGVRQQGPPGIGVGVGGAGEQLTSASRKAAATGGYDLAK